MNFYNASFAKIGTFVKNEQMHIFRTLIFSLLITGYTQAQQLPDHATVSITFQGILDEITANETLAVAGISMAVIAPDLDISWTGASGYDSTTKDQALQANQPFRIASITKSFVATTILRLQEQGKLSIEDPISAYISEEYQVILKGEGYDPEVITIQHCLWHRSGLFDYAMGSDDYIEAAQKDPKKRWTRTEQLQFAMDHGKPLGKPGEVYGYSDTGYILLGAIIEKATEQPLAMAIRTILNYNDLELKSTWLESLEERPKELRRSVRRYMGDVDTTDWDNSVDLYGGGGLSSTTMDLAVFFNALFNKGVYKQENTLEIMLADAGPLKKNQKEGSTYHMGLWEIPVFDGIGYMHDGFWGTAWVYVPEFNATIAVNYTNDTKGAGVFSKTMRKIREWAAAN